MYIRRKRNRSGTTSVVVIEKRNGKARELTTIGVSSDEQEIDHLINDGKERILK